MSSTEADSERKFRIRKLRDRLNPNTEDWKRYTKHYGDRGYELRNWHFFGHDEAQVEIEITQDVINLVASFSELAATTLRSYLEDKISSGSITAKGVALYRALLQYPTIRKYHATDTVQERRGEPKHGPHDRGREQSVRTWLCEDRTLPQACEKTNRGEAFPERASPESSHTQTDEAC